MSHPARSLDWSFPLPRPYTGVHLANGTQGLLVWGVDRLSLTVARTGFWDRRGAIPFTSRITFAGVRRLLEAGDLPALKEAFASPPSNIPYRTPTQLPGGRIDLVFAAGARPVSARLDLATATLVVTLSDGGRVRLRQSTDTELAWLELDNTTLDRVETVPAWRYLETTLAPGGVAAPATWGDASHGGFHQSLPADPGLALAWHRRDAATLVLATALDTPAASAAEQARALAREADLAAAATRATAWWAAYWREVPRLTLPDPALQRHWDYGLVKQAGLTPPQGVPATLQGAWMDETELPPWSNDYHFNINVQMIHWPAFPTNRTEHLRPIWDLLLGWLPELRRNAAAFFGADDALMLPHAVDDRCQVIGNFWQGTIDQACTAWMAQLAWLHYRHTLDEKILRDIAWPLLTGAFGGFWAMTEEIVADGRQRLSLPISVSAEFGEWGRDASFQLAAYHCIAQILPRAAALLGQPVDPRWARVRAELPEATTHKLAKVWGEKELRPRIGLWQGRDLPESHRHHSHLAAIFPFCTFDPLDDAHRDLTRRSIERWTELGAGNWVGWSMPWAAMLWARTDNASAAVSVLKIWEDIFTNLGGGSLHNADSPGYSNWNHGPFFDGPVPPRTNDQMQMDASLGYLQAVVEILVQQRGDSLHILPDLPKQWRDFEFDGVLAEGAFLVGATVASGRVTEIRIHSRAGAPLRLVLPRGGRWSLDGAPLSERVFSATTLPGLTLRFSSLA